MKNLSSYNQDLSIPRKKDVDAKQDKITINGIVQGDGAGNLSVVETVNADLLDLNPATVGLGNVDNVKQYSATNPPPYPVTSVNGATGEVKTNWYFDVTGSVLSPATTQTIAQILAAQTAGFAPICKAVFSDFQNFPATLPALLVSRMMCVFGGIGSTGGAPAYLTVMIDASGNLTAMTDTVAVSADIPVTLPNPYTLDIQIGDTTTSYDGSVAKTVKIPEGGGTDESLGITSAAVGDSIRVKTVDAAGKPTTWESIAPTLSMLKTRYDTIVDYTFNGTSTLSTAEGLSEYILWNGCKAVWNKDAQGNPLKAVRMWGYIECTKAVTQEDLLSTFKLSAACRGSYFYQDTPSSWYYGDDVGNGIGTYELNDESILNSNSIPINRTTYGWCDHIARCGAVQSPSNKNTWTGTLKRSFAAASVLNLAQANYYKDYIYAAMLVIGAAKSDYIIPDGVRIVVVAEVIDE